MSSKLQIPSIEDIDKARPLVTESKVPSHFKRSNSSAVQVSGQHATGSESLTSSTSLQSVTVYSNSLPTSQGTKCLASEQPSSIGCRGNQPIPAADLGSGSEVGKVKVSVTSEVSTNHAEESVSGKGLASAATSAVSSGDGASAGPVRAPGINSIIVNSRQKGNPILKFVRRVPWEFGDISPDYQIGPASCVLYLSLKYHNLNPNYIHERLKQLANSFTLRVLLVQVDVKDPHHSLKELAAMCILADCTLILAFTLEEAGRYLETYKSFENKPPDLIMEKTEANYLAKVTDVLTSAKKVNKTDAATLLSAFGSFAKMTEASEEDLSLCPGLGPQKAQRLHKVFHQTFLKDPKAS